MKFFERLNNFAPSSQSPLMQATIFFGVGLVSAVGWFAGAAAAQLSPIWLRPGQCVMISSQQICAENPTQPQNATTTTTVNPANVVDQRLLVCKWGVEDAAEPGIKGWGLYQVKIMGDSSRQEVLVKSYGPAGQKECEASAKTQKAQ